MRRFLMFQLKYRLAIVAATYLLATIQAARAQSIIYDFQQTMQRKHYDVGTEIGRAMDICEHHSHGAQFVYLEGETPREYDRAWDACYTIRKRWNASEDAERQRKEKEQEQRDHEFVNNLAATERP